MTLKLIGAVIVVFSSGAVGFMMAASVKKEVAQHRDLIDVINFMECEMNCRLTPLPSLCRLAARQGRSMQHIFQTFAEQLEKQISPEPSTCMEFALGSINGISPKIIDYLRDLSGTFGKFDLQGQLLGLYTVRQRCCVDLEILEKSKISRMRNYRTISVCIGVLVTVLLL